MGAFRATVSMRGREIEILFSHLEFSRKTDNKGRPVTSVIGGRLTFSIESTKDTEILEAMINSQFKPSVVRLLSIKSMIIPSLELSSSGVLILFISKRYSM